MHKRNGQVKRARHRSAVTGTDAVTFPDDKVAADCRGEILWVMTNEVDDCRGDILWVMTNEVDDCRGDISER